MPLPNQLHQLFVDRITRVGKGSLIRFGRVASLHNAQIDGSSSDIDDQGVAYYESMAVEDLYHPQNILAYELNDKPLDVPHGAPLRLRFERQLGYKHAKYVRAIELVSTLGGIGGGKGGYWEDQGYEWYAGI